MIGSIEVVVLRDEVGHDDLHAVARAEGWSLRAESARAHLVLASRRWETDGGLEISHVYDHLGGAHWLRLAGPAARGTAARLRGRLPHHTEDELLSAVLDGDQPDAITCVRVASKLAACRPEQMEPRHLAALERLLGHPTTAVRRAGIRSAYSCPWSQLRSIVRRRLGQEKRLRPQLEHLAEYLDGASKG